MVTDQPERIIVGELIREKALLLLREEVPHGVGVGVDKMERREDRDLMDVYATIYCERDSHKGIIIGKGGSMLKRIGQDSRKDIEWMLGCPVNLQLWVKIKEDWRNRPGMLHELGYE
jgi:GTP-binding protein Era